MINLLNTYRSFFFGLLIFSYVFSVFQKPIFETLHLLCHTPDIIFSNGKVHSFSDHEATLHSHENLAAIYNSTDEKGESPQPQSEQEIKKKVEMNEVYSSNSEWKTLAAKKQFQIHLPFQSIFQKIPNPPPRFS